MEPIDWGRATARQCFERLDRLVEQKWGRGGKARLERELGFKPGWYKSHRRRHQVISLPNLLAALKLLDEPPEDFFAEVGDEPEGEELPPGAPPLIVREVYNAMGRHAWPRAATEPAWYRELDEVRFDDPFEALEKVKCLLARISATDDFARALAISGSCYRMLEQSMPAAHCLVVARSLAAHNELLQGDLCQRLSSVYNKVAPRRGLRFAETASLIFSKNRALRKVGETLIDIANSHYALGDFTNAQEFLSAARRYTAELRPRNRAALYQGLAIVSHRSGRSGDARHWLSRALSAAHNASSRSLLAHVLWTHGVIEREVDSFRSALSLLSQFSPYEALTCFIDMVESIDNEQIRIAIRGLNLNFRSGFASRVLENLTAQLLLDKTPKIQRERERIKKWRARELEKQLAHHRLMA